jgi:hypothetical protein
MISSDSAAGVKQANRPGKEAHRITLATLATGRSALFSDNCLSRGSLQFNPEGGPLAAIGHNSYLASHFFNGLSGNGKANSCAFVSFVLGGPLEHPEKAGLIGRFDADSIVREPQSNLASPALTGEIASLDNAG